VRARARDAPETAKLFEKPQRLMLAVVLTSRKEPPSTEAASPENSHAEKIFGKSAACLPMMATAAPDDAAAW